MQSLAANVVVELARWLKGNGSAAAREALHPARLSLERPECPCRFCVCARTVQRLRQINRCLDRASAERNELLCGRLLADQIGLMELLLEERTGPA